MIFLPPLTKEVVFLAKINNVFNLILKLVGYILSFLLVALVLIVCLQTFFRYVVFHSLSWSEELSRYLFVIIVSCGFGIGITNDSLIRINIIDGRISHKTRKFMDILYAASGVFVCWILAKYNFQLIDTGMTRLTSALGQIRFGHIYMAMEVGFILSLLASMLKLIQAIMAFGVMLKGSDTRK